MNPLSLWCIHVLFHVELLGFFHCSLVTGEVCLALGVWGVHHTLNTQCYMGCKAQTDMMWQMGLKLKETNLVSIAGNGCAEVKNIVIISVSVETVASTVVLMLAWNAANTPPPPPPVRHMHMCACMDTYLWYFMLCVFRQESWLGLVTEINMEIHRISARNLGRDDRWEKIWWDARNIAQMPGRAAAWVTKLNGWRKYFVWSEIVH